MLRRNFLKAGLAALLTPLALVPTPKVVYKSTAYQPPPLGYNRIEDLYLSPEALKDIREWTVAEVDEVTRKEVFSNETS